MNIFYFTRANLLSGLKPTTRFAALAIAVLLLAACGGGSSSSGGGGVATDSISVATFPSGNVTSFPDDGAVFYALNITRQNPAPSTLSLNVTTAITGTCSIDPIDTTTLIYDENYQASTDSDYSITFTGAATAGGACDVSFTATDNELSQTITRSITFNAEESPNLGATLRGNATGASTNVPADQLIQVDVTATKQDNSISRDVTFPPVIVSSSTPSCTAALDGDINRQYDGAIAGTSAVTVTYNVLPTVFAPVANCGTFPFDVTEGSTTANINFADGISFGEPNGINLAPTVTTFPVGDITSFPDDGTVLYTLNIARHESASPTSVDAAAEILDDGVGDCSITPTDTTTLIYDEIYQASTDVIVTFTGSATTGGTCEIDLHVIEAGRSVTVSRSVTFNAEQAPTLGATLLGNATGAIANVPANQLVRVNVTATKQDASNTPDVAFLDMVTSSGGCVATLDGDGITRQYAGVNVGSMATATYNVASVALFPVADCGTFLFAVTEGSATANSNLAAGIYFGERNDINLAPAVTIDPVGPITDVFPDEGSVSYTLNITRHEFALPTLSLTVTPTTTGSCRIIPASTTGLTYNANNQTTTSFDITYSGTNKSSEGNLLGGSCDIEFQVVESVETEAQRTVTLSRNITFNAEVAPFLFAELIGVGENIPNYGQARVELTATKGDTSTPPVITFPAEIMTANDCTATLADAGAANSQYSNAADRLTAVATYNVRPTIINGEVSNCGVFMFSATEGSATGSINFYSNISFFMDTDSDGLVDHIDNCPNIANLGQSDIDNDGDGDVCDEDIDDDGDLNAVDVDDDGDGLIDIRTVVQLNMMRNNLNGTGLDANNADGVVDAGGNSTGCGGLPGITTCNGYEQMANIDLEDLGRDASGSNWEPVGTCGGSNCNSGSGAQFFSGVFSGNNFTLSNLLINVTSASYGVGFFGAISPTAQVQNVHIRGGNINRAAVTSQYVGGLVGRGNGATISNSSVTLGVVSGSRSVGGLIGFGTSVIISSSVATVDSIGGDGGPFVGGLVGNGNGAEISSSVATVDSISGGDSVGGLAGLGERTAISSSAATVGSVSGSQFVGGLVGNGDHATISSSVAIVGFVSGGDRVGGLVSGGDRVGGLVGDGYNTTISSSVATIDSISSGATDVGGLLGNGFLSTISSSVAVTNTITGTNSVGGLVGSGDSVTASYWDSRVTLTPSNGNTFGMAQTMADLRTPIDFTDIYATWGNAYCNPNTGELSGTASDGFVPVWNLGTASEYPAINCIPTLSPAQQREAGRRALAGESPLVD